MAFSHLLTQATEVLFVPRDDEDENDARARAHGLRRICEYNIFSWVATYVVTERGEILLQQQKAKGKKLSLIHI